MIFEAAFRGPSDVNLEPEGRRLDMDTSGAWGHGSCWGNQKQIWTKRQLIAGAHCQILAGQWSMGAPLCAQYHPLLSTVCKAQLSPDSYIILHCIRWRRLSEKQHWTWNFVFCWSHKIRSFIILVLHDSQVDAEFGLQSVREPAPSLCRFPVCSLVFTIECLEHPLQDHLEFGILTL